MDSPPAPPSLLRPEMPRAMEFSARLIASLLLISLGYVLFCTVALSTRWNWSACRLAPVLAVFRGYPLYSLPEGGPINGWLYGPIPALAWMPAALAPSPLSALVIASTINLAFLLAPLCLAAKIGTSGGNTIATTMAGIAGISSLFLVYPTWYMASALNADATAAGLGVTSCLLLLGPKPLSDRRLALAATFNVLAVWSKLVEAPLILAQLGWLLAQREPGSVRRFGTYYLVILLVVSGFIFGLFDWRSVVFNAWIIPTSHQLVGGVAAVFSEITDFFSYTAMWWLAGLLLMFACAGNRPPTNRSGPTTLASWFLLICAGLFLLPTGALASVKIGGDRNSMHSAYYFAVSASYVLARSWQPGWPRLASWMPLAVITVAIAANTAAVRRIASYVDLPMLPRQCLSQEDWRLAKQHPGEIYFPWDPLATLLAEGRMYHFEYGVLDRIFAHRRPALETIRSGLPKKMNSIIYPQDDARRVMLKEYLHDFSETRHENGWRFFSRDPVTDEGRRLNPR